VIPKRSLGDSVYAAWWEEGIVLTTAENGHPDDPSNTIYLEPDVCRAFLQFWRDVQTVPNATRGAAPLNPTAFLASRVPPRSNQEIRAYTYSEVLEVLQDYAKAARAAAPLDLRSIVVAIPDVLGMLPDPWPHDDEVSGFVQRLQQHLSEMTHE
jgi:hypothetical protein